MDIIKTLASELKISEKQVGATLDLIHQGDTIPFIARYRKEVTGSLDDVTLRKLSERLEALQSLEERRQSILKSVEEQGKLTADLAASFQAAKTLSELENLYRPYKKKRKTKATIAKEAGLSPLAEIILAQKCDEQALFLEAKRFFNPDKGILTEEDAVSGASNIVAEIMGDIPRFYEEAKTYILKSGRLESKETKDDVEKRYATYASFSCPIRSLKSYQTLALTRGEKEKGLSVSFAYDRYTMINLIARTYLVLHSPLDKTIRSIAEDAYKRLIAPSVETEIRNDLFLKAEDESILLFKDNLKQLLLTPPLKGKRVLGFDPAFINGCKLAVVDENGKLLGVGVIYPTVGGANKQEESKRVVLDFLQKYRCDVIALGNGTAGRESEAFLRKILAEAKLDTPIVIVNEAGASVYSASELSSKEFPDLPVEKRSAISLARRLQDPLAELVKINPMNLGVGQYQHDLDKKKLAAALSGVVEDCVNEVGVYVNSASPSLLSFVSGIGPSLAKAIVDYRDANGAFHQRGDLKKVLHLGPKAYEQCAGFLRIKDGYPLDNTGVHPESYPLALALLKRLGISPDELGTPKAREALEKIKKDSSLLSSLGSDKGLETFSDIVEELEKPGRDPREKAIVAELDSEVRDIKDLRVGMVLNGTIRNIADFGAFVDIGVHQDGLIHISELSDGKVASPLEVVHINEVVRVKVISVDISRKRIGLSLRQVHIQI